MANGRISYDIGFNVNKSDIKKVEKAFEDIRNLTGRDVSLINQNTLKEATGQLEKARIQATKLEEALMKAYNAKLGTVNIKVFNKALADSKTDLNQVYQSMSKVGVVGQDAFRKIVSQTLNTNFQLKESSSLLKEIGTTLKNTIKWNIASSAINNLTGSIQQAYGYVKNLDTSLNDIRIVTGASADAMDVFAQKANKAAGELKKSTTDYTNAALIYYQQGLGDEEVAARTEVTLKAANVTGQDTAEVSEQLTAIWNGYKVQAAEAELYIDKVAAVAAKTASDLEELATGMSKVASAADLMGVDIDQLNAQIATIISVTRQAPESVGTALKTIYARMGDIEAGIDTETTLGNYTEQMAAMGVNVLDMNGQLRDMGEVIEEIGGKWSTMSREQQIALSQTMAGTRQYNNLLSLFDNWDMYTDALKTSANAAGTLQEQQDIFAESTKGNLQELATAAEGVFDSLLTSDMINGVVEPLTDIVSGLETFIDAIGGGVGALNIFGPLLIKSFSPEIAENALKFVKNLNVPKENEKALSNRLKQIKEIKKELSKNNNIDITTIDWLDKEEEISKMGSLMDPGQFEDLENKLKKYTNTMSEAAKATEKFESIWTEIKNQSDFFAGDAFEVNEGEGPSEVLDKIQKYQDYLEQMKTNDLNDENKDFLANLFKSGTVPTNLDTGAIDKIIEDLSEMATLYDNLASAEKEKADADNLMNSSSQELNQTMSDFSLQKAIETTVELTSSVAGLTSTVINFKSSWSDIWNDTDLSLTEKLAQSMTLLGTTIATVVTSISTIKASLEKYNIINLKSIISTKAKAAAEKNLTALNVLRGGTESHLNAVTETNTLINLKNAASFKLQAAAMKMGMASTASFLALLGGIAIAVAAVTVAIYAGVKAYNKDKEAAESAAKASENLA